MIKYRIRVRPKSHEEIGVIAYIMQRSDPNIKHWFELREEDTRELAEQYAFTAQLAGFDAYIEEFNPALEESKPLKEQLKKKLRVE